MLSPCWVCIIFLSLLNQIEPKLFGALTVVDEDVYTTADKSLCVTIHILTEVNDDNWERIAPFMRICCSVRSITSYAVIASGCQLLGDAWRDALPTVEFCFVGIGSSACYIHSWIQLFAHGGGVFGTDSYKVTRHRSQQAAFSNDDWLRSRQIFPVHITEKNCNPKQLLFEYDPTQYPRWILQMSTSAFCSKYALPVELCLEATLQATEHLLLKTATFDLPLLPKIMQAAPSARNPFVFLHIEKCAGTFVRNILSRAAEKLEVFAVIPGKGNVRNVMWSLEDQDFQADASPLSQVAILAGHFQWRVWMNLPSYIDSHRSSISVEVSSTGHLLSRSPLAEIIPPPCFVMYRHPVARVISYYYRRVYSDKVPVFNRTLNEWSPDELRDLLIYIRHPTRLPDGSSVISDEGMSDAACRALSGRRFTTGVEYRVGETIQIPPEMDSKDTELALENCRQCVVGIQEDMESTLAVMRYWFPWLKDITAEVPPGVNIGHNQYLAEDITQLRDDIREAIEEENKCDVRLYNVALDQFARQLNVMNSDSVSSSHNLH